jgi:sulfide:quinone oxidoreductase
MERKRVVVLGGGIGGAEAAISLRKKGFDVELVSDRDYLFVYPLAIWIPTGERSFDRVTIPLADLARAHGFKLTVDRVASLSGATRTFTLEQQGERSDFDYLVLALGAHKTAHKGKEHVLSICGAPEESVKVQRRLNELLAKGSGTIAVGFGGNPKDPSGVRGGPAFEFLLNVHHLLKKRGLRASFDLTFFAPMASPGIRMGEKAVATMDRMFRSLGIHQRIGKKITEFVENGVVFEDGSTLQADLTMFIAAGDGHAVVKASDLPQNDAGFVTISPSCEVTGHPWLYAIGDVAALEGPDWKAKQGHMAELMARIAAQDMAHKEGARKKAPSYVDHVCILCVMDMGNGAGFVYRNRKRSLFLPMPIVGHWLKKGWGRYFELSKRGKVPRIPGM